MEGGTRDWWQNLLKKVEPGSKRLFWKKGRDITQGGKGSPGIKTHSRFPRAEKISGGGGRVAPPPP